MGDNTIGGLSGSSVLGFRFQLYSFECTIRVDRMYIQFRPAPDLLEVTNCRIGRGESVTEITDAFFLSLHRAF